MEEEIFSFKIVPRQERFYNENTAYGVYSFTTDNDIPNCYECYDPQMNKTKGCILAGNVQRLTIGIPYEVKAKLSFNKKYDSYQYEPITVTPDIPKSYEAQVDYLRTQVTITQAKNILAAYPNVVDDVINGREINYRKIKGIGEKSWNKIRDNLIKNYGVADIITMLRPYGVTVKMVQKLLSSYSSPQILKQELEKNPYILTKLKGLGFKRVDDLALKLVPKMRNSEERTIAFLRYYFQWLGENEGDTWIPVNQLDTSVREIIPECEEHYKRISEEEKATPRFLHIEDNMIGLQEYYNKEHSCVGKLRYLDAIKTDYQVNIQKGIEIAERQQGFTYTPEQIESLKKCCESNVVLICGGAGVGKTSLLRGLIAIYRNYSIACCALSAKAAQRIYEATGHPATTIHRLLKYNGIAFGVNPQNPLFENIIIIDEASMINTSLFLSLLSAIKEGSKVIICGDDGQLPPIGYGNTFHDLLNLDLFNSCKLTKIMRQAAKSGIITDAWAVRNNTNPLDKYELKITRGELQDMTYMFRDDRKTMRDLAIKIFLKTLEKYGNIEDIAIITPCKKNRTNCTQDINNIILNTLIPRDSNNEITYGDKVFREGARIIQVVNDYKQDVFNGEMGYVRKIYTRCNDKGKTEQVLEAEFGDKTVIYRKQDLDNVELGYCLTIHKMQGSGIKYVIVVIDNTHYKLLDSCLLYTGLTRAVKKCLLIAEPQAYDRCIRTKASDRRTWISLCYQNS